MLCDKCKTEIKPTALLFGTTPGWSCECQWGSLSKQEFKQMFGHGFKRVKLPNVAMGGVYSGNSQNRRRQKRNELRLLKEAREAMRLIEASTK